uniref:Histone H1 n=1 Tax=Myripristis murdjan TaxID=586833 RepID=A0A667WXL8_9TELE
MAEEAPAPAAAAPAKAPKKKRVRPKKSGPSLGELIVKAVSASKERGGVSLAALKKALAAAGYDVDNNKARVRLAVKSLVTKGTLLRTKGTGASGSFKINNKLKADKRLQAARHTLSSTHQQPQPLLHPREETQPPALFPSSALQLFTRLLKYQPHATFKNWTSCTRYDRLCNKSKCALILQI